MATSLLIRELLLLRSQVVNLQSFRSRQRLSRYFYFVKKYFKYIAKDLVNSRFDSASQKADLLSYFNNINEHLDSLNSSLKLGTLQSRDNVISQIDVLIYLASIEEYGEIPNMIPEIKNFLRSKSFHPKQLSFVVKTFQVLDTSWSVRTLVLIIMAIIISLLYPSLWEYIQNLSALAGLL